MWVQRFERLDSEMPQKSWYSQLWTVANGWNNGKISYAFKINTSVINYILWNLILHTLEQILLFMCLICPWTTPVRRMGELVGRQIEVHIFHFRTLCCMEGCSSACCTKALIQWSGLAWLLLSVEFKRGSFWIALPFAIMFVKYLIDTFSVTIFFKFKYSPLR